MWVCVCLWVRTITFQLNYITVISHDLGIWYAGLTRHCLSPVRKQSSHRWFKVSGRMLQKWSVRPRVRVSSSWRKLLHLLKWTEDLRQGANANFSQSCTTCNKYTSRPVHQLLTSGQRFWRKAALPPDLSPRWRVSESILRPRCRRDALLLRTNLQPRVAAEFAAYTVISMGDEQPQNSPFPGEIRAPPITWFLGPTRVHNPNGCTVSSSVFVGLTVVSNRQTDADHATSATTGRIFALCACDAA